MPTMGGIVMECAEWITTGLEALAMKMRCAIAGVLDARHASVDNGRRRRRMRKRMTDRLQSSREARICLANPMSGMDPSASIMSQNVAAATPRDGQAYCATCTENPRLAMAGDPDM